MADERKQYTMSRRGASFGGLAALAGALLPLQIVHAQNYPNRPVRLILPFGAGGVADVTARLVTERLGEKLGQRFVIENMSALGQSRKLSRSLTSICFATHSIFCGALP